MEKFLYIFGYETPGLAIANKQMGTDFEDSMAFFIVAQNKEKAFEWGEKLADEYMKVMFNDTFATRESHGSASYIQDDYTEHYSEESLKQIQVVHCGEYPDIKSLVMGRYSAVDLTHLP